MTHGRMIDYNNVEFCLLYAGRFDETTTTQIGTNP
jgi:hypothetical protein